MVKKRILLSNSTLVVTELWEGKLVIGELQFGSASKKEIQRALAEKGYEHGILEHCIDLLQNGHKGQIPIALANIEEDPGKPFFHFEKELNDENFDNWIKEGSFDNLNITYPVKAGDTLLTLSQKPYQYLRYPDGRKEYIADLETTNINFYAGENTKLRHDGEAIIAKTDGYAHRSIYGTVSVYPEHILKNIGKMHGRVELESAVRVEQDVRTESQLITPSSVIVEGLIRSSNVRSGGNIYCAFGLDNSQRLDSARIHAGQSLFASSIVGYNVWVGHYCIVQNNIDHALVQCMNSMVAPVISGSEIRIGNRLFTRQLERSTIYLGSDHVMDPNLQTVKRFHQQHEKRLFDLFLFLDEQQRDLDFTRKKALNHLAKLNKVARGNIASDILLNRFYINMKDGLAHYRELLEKTKSTLNEFADEKRQLAFYETHTKKETSPEIIVTGKIGNGCAIISSNETFRVREPMENVSIRLNRSTKTLEIKPLS